MWLHSEQPVWHNRDNADFCNYTSHSIPYYKRQCLSMCIPPICGRIVLSLLEPYVVKRWLRYFEWGRVSFPPNKITITAVKCLDCVSVICRTMCLILHGMVMVTHYDPRKVHIIILFPYKGPDCDPRKDHIIPLYGSIFWPCYGPCFGPMKVHIVTLEWCRLWPYEGPYFGHITVHIVTLEWSIFWPYKGPYCGTKKVHI